ncbi:hypothetical protein PoB_003508500 [Plakobranchus ocellatus]|uniref:Muniscin C-terminal domain-containing protein n=1 Tax=Plakobranchus ocellatus TaxID=259542 RepID=A0AAV4ANX1_9GAST|nr:hypothetical protein PoB_003508500 [Plakobranchus ocellatus]
MNLTRQLQQIVASTERAQAATDADPVTKMVESHLKKFSTDQHRILSNLREDLQQQNQALISDISRLLEGFASLVGQVVKKEVETALTELNLGASEVSGSSKLADDSRQASVRVSDSGSIRTWSKVHRETVLSEDCSSSSVNCASVEDAMKQQHIVTETKAWTRNKKKQSQQQVPVKSSASVTNAKSNGGSIGVVKPHINTEGASPAEPNLSVYAGIHSEENVSSSVHFFPDDHPANMLVFNVSSLAVSGKITKSPVYYLQDCPCKVQLGLWFDSKNELAMNATLWGLAPQALNPPRIFTLNGSIKNKNSGSYTALFAVESQPFSLKKSTSQTIKMDLSLRTKRGTHSNLTIANLQSRNYVMDDRDSISINWNVISKDEFANLL